MNQNFFQSLPFGIIALCIMGSSWTLTGLVLGDAPKHAIPTSAVNRMGAIFSLVASVVIMCMTGAYPHGSAMTFALTLFFYILTGFISAIMCLIMSLAMQAGPNGAIWTIVQSGTVWSFIGGILFFGVKATPARLCGICLLLLALFLYGRTKDSDTSSPTSSQPIMLWGWRFSWLQLAFICFALVGIQHNITTIPSYFEQFRSISPIFRNLCVTIGSISGTFFWSITRHESHPFTFSHEILTNRRFWMYVLSLQFFGLLFAYTLFYPGMDILAKAGLGGMSYPLMVGSSIIAFTLTSFLLLKERMRPLQIAALVICIAGLLLLCRTA